MKPSSVCTVVAFVLVGVAFGAHSSPETPDRAERVRLSAGERAAIALRGLDTIDPSRTAVAVSVSLSEWDARTRIRVAVAGDEEGHSDTAKVLHWGDTEFFALYRPGAARSVVLTCDGGAGVVEVRWAVVGPWSTDGAYAVEQEPNDSPEQANRYSPGRSVLAGAASEPYRGPDDYESSAWDKNPVDEDWYRFRWNGDGTALAFIWIDLQDREVPPDVTLYEVRQGELVPVEPSFEKFQPERSTEYVGFFKFVARPVQPDRDYFIRVRARHPFYILRSALYELPPYLHGEGEVDDEQVRDAVRKAIRVAQDYALLKGEGWHANTPRTGAVANRWRNVHAETAQCIACHPTQFNTRGALYSVANGYAVRRREQLDFLIDRLQNNPRPFYGFPEAVWTRVISAAANSVSRPAVLLRLYGDHVAPVEQSRFQRAAFEYLWLYYHGRDTLPPDESNGNRPLVSAFEIALHSWQVAKRLAGADGDERYHELAKEIESLIATADDRHVEDMLDLCYQTLAFCRIDRQRYQERIEANVRRILELQRPDGRWAMTFRPEDLPSEFQTAHCVYVLAVAGLKPDHPAIRRAVLYLLRHQEPFGGWFDDEDPRHPHPYENFQTPFRETQFALMALSQLYPGGERPPRHASDEEITDEWNRVATALDSPGDHSDGRLCELIARAAESKDPLLRLLAARAAGRGLHCGVKPLEKLLRDPVWPVRRAAAWAVRRLGNNGLPVPELREILTLTDPRVRRDGLQVLQYHFRFWVGNRTLLDCLLDRLQDDPDPVCRLLVSRTLWKWWYWTPDESARAAIERALVKALLREQNEVVVVNLQEAVYNVCDENVRYLYNNWIPRLARREWQEKAIHAQQATAGRQARLLADALTEAGEDKAGRLLGAIGWFHLRGPVAGAGRERRIGNDVETIRFYRPDADDLADQVVRYMGHDRPELRLQALLAALTFRDSDARALVAPHVLRLVVDEDPQVRRVSRRFAESYLRGLDEASPAVVASTVATLLRTQDSYARAMAIKVLGRVRLEGGFRDEVVSAIEEILQTAEEAEPDLLLTIRTFPELQTNRRALRMLRAAMRGGSAPATVAATLVVLGSPRLRTEEMFRRPLDEVLNRAKDDPELTKQLLRGLSEEPDVRGDVFVASLAAQALRSSDPSVRAVAVDVVRRVPALASNAAVRLALQELAAADQGLASVVAEALYRGEAGGARLVVSGAKVEELLDFEYFRRRVQPIFFKKGPDGQACVDCHLNHGLLNLVAPDNELDELTAARHNYRSTLRVVDLVRPEASLLLRKPLSDATQEGLVGGKLAHGGGVRWPEGKQSQEYQIILEWLNGARLDEAAGR